MTTTTDNLANVPFPAGATQVHDWYDPDGRIGEPAPVEFRPDVRRSFQGSSWVVERPDQDRDVHVLIDGEQLADGRVAERVITLDDDSLTPQLARQLAAALIAAADEADQMARYDAIGW